MGVAVLLLGAFTAWTTGIVKSIPVVAHAMLDYALAALLIAMPFLLGFSDDGTASAFFVVCGVLGCCSRSPRGSCRTHRRWPRIRFPPRPDAAAPGPAADR